MTNEEYITGLSRKHLAKLLIKEDKREEWDYDYNEDPFFWGLQSVFVTSDGVEFWEDYDGALQHECWWLAQEHKAGIV